MPHVLYYSVEMARNVTLVLVDSDGAALGALPPFAVSTPWWQVVSEVVDEARRLYGVELDVLRLLSTDRARAQGGNVSYSARLTKESLSATVPLSRDVPEAARRELAAGPHPLRAPWAQPDGPRRSVEWAQSALLDAGRGPHVARQRRTWNLSAIWQLDAGPSGDGAPPVWLKQVPAFFAHEGAVLRWLRHVAPTSIPDVIAAGTEGRLLLEHAAGEDRHGAPAKEREAFATIMHRIQCAAVDATSELVRWGVPDRRGRRLALYVREALANLPSEAAVDEHDVAELLDTLEPAMAALAECGIPDTVVHGDLHPGNVRGEENDAVIIDWGDVFIGHPGFDILRLTEDLQPDEAAPLLSSWSARWRRERPGCDPDRALSLLRPVAALHAAAIYASFVANIEPSEHVYHANDVAPYLQKARAGMGCA